MCKSRFKETIIKSLTKDHFNSIKFEYNNKLGLKITEAKDTGDDNLKTGDIIIQINDFKLCGSGTSIDAVKLLRDEINERNSKIYILRPSEETEYPDNFIRNEIEHSLKNNQKYLKFDEYNNLLVIKNPYYFDISHTDNYNILKKGDIIIEINENKICEMSSTEVRELLIKLQNKSGLQGIVIMTDKDKFYRIKVIKIPVKQKQMNDIVKVEKSDGLFVITSKTQHIKYGDIITHIKPRKKKRSQIT